jgi:hypothetical protein
MGTVPVPYLQYLHRYSYYNRNTVNCCRADDAVTLFVPSGGSVRPGAQPARLPHQTGSRSRSFCPPHDAKHVSRYKYRHSQFGVYRVLEVFWIFLRFSCRPSLILGSLAVILVFRSIARRSVVLALGTQCCGSGVFIPDPNFFHPGSEFFPPRIRIN